jgi:hypothetical protein
LKLPLHQAPEPRFKPPPNPHYRVPCDPPSGLWSNLPPALPHDLASQASPDTLPDLPLSITFPSLPALPITLLFAPPLAIRSALRFGSSPSCTEPCFRNPKPKIPNPKSLALRFALRFSHLLRCPTFDNRISSTANRNSPTRPGK